MAKEPRFAGFDTRLIAPLVLGAILNPVNSSILAVSLVPIGRDLHAPSSQTAWLVTALYVATAIGQPLAGRLVDRYGTRPAFMLGSALTGVAGIIGTVAPSLGVLVAARVLLGFGTCAGYPAAMSLIRREADRTGVESPGAILTTIAVSAQTVVVVGPALGGLLIGAAGWRATLAVNVPLALAGLWLGARRLPDGPVPQADEEAVKSFDVGAFIGNAPLMRTYARMLLTMIIGYSFLYGFTQWMEDTGGLSAAQAGLVLLPMSVVAIGVSALTGRHPELRGKLLVGAATQIVVAVLLLGFDAGTGAWLFVVAAAVFGLPQGLNTLANQNAVFHQADRARVGVSAGLLRTAGYLGAIVSSVATGTLFGDRAGTGGLHALAALVLVVGVALFVLTLLDRTLNPGDLHAQDRPHDHRPPAGTRVPGRHAAHAGGHHRADG